MALTITTVTGIIDLPNGDTPVAARLIFELSGWAKDGANIFVKGPIEVAVTQDGSFSVSLQTTDDLPVSYQVAVGYRIPSIGTDVTTRLGQIAVPAFGPVILGDLLAIPAPVPTVPDALAQALAAAAEAKAMTVNADQVAADRQAAVDAKNVAVGAKVDAESARDAAFINANVYPDIATGRAAVADGGQFQVVSGDEIVRYRRDSATTQTEVARFPSAAAITDMDAERLKSRRAAWLEDARLRPSLLPKAAVVILLGQSNNAPRGTSISGTVSRDVFMPVGGNSITYFPYNATNATWAMSWADVASAVTHAEGASETPCSGVAIGLLGGQFQRIYIASAAIGARDLDTLRTGGPMQNMFGLVHRLCDLARAAGYDPVVKFDTHHGEADAAKGASEADYYADGWAYYRQAQAFAAQAMGRPDYDAPIAFHMPIIGSSEASRNVARAIVRLAKDLPNGILAGGSYQFPTENDRVHQEEDGYRIRGEQGGFLLRRLSDGFERRHALQIVDAVWSGTTATVIFNREIVRDTGVDYGTNLNTENALAGLEFLDDGTFIKINSITVQGRVATLTLASAPVGTTQHVQIASQTITGALTVGSNNLPGSQIRAAATGEPSIYTPTRVIGDFAAPQKFEARP